MKTMFLLLFMMACGGVNQPPVSNTGQDRQVVFLCDDETSCTYRGLVLCPRNFIQNENRIVYVSYSDGTTFHGHQMTVVCK